MTSLAAEEGVNKATEILRRQDGGIRALDRLTAEVGRQSAGAYLDDRGRPVVYVLSECRRPGFNKRRRNEGSGL
ncbi:hypothetical protein RM572_28585 [Streptomyces sp. DSM 42041]|uniref:Uncharacterized protein n=1 Tax=Streptomyces hazeniae TaxID=3075538 RepID=A0ABU2P0D5_9ACTN|nr:hypothetical protein [Streptomyces sp. DSM 42041]MDT0382710.1 hypothetical protein [Streptomyces sp. DSM 42041]